MAWGEYILRYKAHSDALKYYRNYAEDPNRPAESAALLIENGWHSIKECKHIHKTAYEFTDQDVTWNWLEMVAQLRDEDIVTLIGSSCGLTKCFMARRPNSYDHKRHHALKQEGKAQPENRLPVWDFVIARRMEDSSEEVIRLHPNYSNTKVDVVEAHLAEVEPPANGEGGSDGRGTFKKYKELGVVAGFRFYVQKCGKAAAKKRVQ